MIIGSILIALIIGLIIGYVAGHNDGRQAVAAEIRNGKFNDYLTDLIYQRLKNSRSRSGTPQTD